MFSIEALPNEIIYRVFDHLSISSIISFTHTCKRFSQCRDGYNQYRLNFQSISKPTFDLICRLIRPSNIIELQLSDDDNDTPGQVQSFLQTFPVAQLTRLTSLALVQINECHLTDLLTHFRCSSLTSLRIEYRQYFGMLNSVALGILTETLALQTLKTLDLDMRSYETVGISWPQASSIERLTLLNVNFHQILSIVSQPNQLQSIKLRNFVSKNFSAPSIKAIDLKDVRSFQIEESELFMESIQWLLSHMSRLQHLKMEGFTATMANIFRHNLLEEFIQSKLHKLQTLQFFIRFSPVEFKINQALIEALIEQFNRPFWTSHLHCPVVCDFIQDCNELHFYSTPSPYRYFRYSDQLTLTSTLSDSNHLNERFHGVSHLDLNLKDLPNVSISLKNASAEHRLFSNLKHLKLTMSDQCPSSCFESLSHTIYLDSLTKLVLIISSRDGGHLDVLIRKFLDFLRRLSTVTSLEIFNRWYGISSLVALPYFCTMIPTNIKHLNVDVSDMDEIPILIEHLPHLFSFKFKFSFDKAIFIKKIVDWLTKHTTNSSYVSDMHYLAIWMSGRVMKTNAHKRMKITR